MTYEFGLRERKKAQLRLDIIDQLLLELQDSDFDDIKVSTLCDRVSISEVTFFKYFQMKSELLLYYMQVWRYRRELRIADDRPVGVDAIYSIFKDIAYTDNVQRLMNTLICYIFKVKERPESISLSDCEKWLIHRDRILEGDLSLEEQLMRGVEEAKANGQIGNDVDSNALYILLATIYYGTPIVSHMSGAQLWDYYRESLNIVLS